MGCVTALKRQHRRGFVLLSTLITLLLLTTLVTAMTVRAQSNVRLMARLTSGLQNAVARDAVYERLRGLVVDAMTGTQDMRPLLDGTGFAVSESGHDWVVHVQDVEGLVDLYLAPAETLRLLPMNVDQFVQNREKALSALMPGERFPTLASSLAKFGLSGAKLAGLVTQSSQTGALRISTMPEVLRERHPNVPPGVREGEQIIRVTVMIE
jgi:hypothetical protein